MPYDRLCFEKLGEAAVEPESASISRGMRTRRKRKFSAHACLGEAMPELFHSEAPFTARETIGNLSWDAAITILADIARNTLTPKEFGKYLPDALWEKIAVDSSKIVRRCRSMHLSSRYIDPEDSYQDAMTLEFLQGIFRNFELEKCDGPTYECFIRYLIASIENAHLSQISKYKRNKVCSLPSDVAVDEKELNCEFFLEGLKQWILIG